MNKTNDKGKNDGRWKCPTCKVEADVKGRNIKIYVVGYTWPLHWDCQFARAIDSINFDELERVS
ncbi:hypothetical protein ES707_00177 [subsurface metagenome]